MKIMYDNGSWYFKIDNYRIGRAQDCSTIRSVEMLKDSILQEYGLLGRLISVDIFLEEMIFLRPELVLMLESITYVGMVDDDEILLRHVLALEAACRCNSKIFKSLGIKIRKITKL
ncbi:hypothetical protein HID58_013463 [Brassica napus]|uniref:Uncharacterized protein n=1 Tax=Brassica napus TaxID=3708 RepID=A0ABQ8E3Y7_BRANA|nr:hypothetical protein HID58_013463 [Brassica napus]